jgi:hypothetical protein
MPEKPLHAATTEQVKLGLELQNYIVGRLRHYELSLAEGLGVLETVRFSLTNKYFNSLEEARKSAIAIPPPGMLGQIGKQDGEHG